MVGNEEFSFKGRDENTGVQCFFPRVGYFREIREVEKIDNKLS